MAGINVGFPFKRTSAAPIDESLVLTKAQMVAADDTMMPSHYFCVCKDDGKLYLYDKSNTVDEGTGKYRVFEGGDYDDTELRNAISTLEQQKATGYFEKTDFDIPLSTAGQPAFSLAKDSFKIEVEGHKPYTYEFTAGDVYNLAQYNETIGKTFIARNEDNETIHVKMTGPLPDNVQYAAVSSNPVLDFTNATATLTKTTFLKQIDEMLIPAASGEVFMFDVNGDDFTEDPGNPGGKHYGTTLTSPTFDEIMDNLVSDKLVFAKINFNNGNTSEMYQLFRTSASSIRGKAFDIEFPQGYIWFYDIYVQKRNYETTTYFGVFADKVSDGGGGGADFLIAHIPGGGGTGEEVKAILSKDADAMSVSYYKDAELPDTVNLLVGEDGFVLPTTDYVDALANERATETKLGRIKLNPSESIELNSEGQLKVGGRMGQLPGSTGIFAPNDRDPRTMANYAMLVTDAMGMNMDANRALAIVSGYGLACQSAAAGTTVYRVNNTYANRIIAKMAEGGYAAKDEATSTAQRIVPVVSVKIGGSTFTPDSSADSSTPIEITVSETLNPDAAITNIRLFGSMSSYATAHIGNGVKSESGGRSLMIGGGISKTGSGNDICMVGNAIYTTGNGNAIFGRNHISRKNRWFIAGSGHDTTNGISEAGAVVGQFADIKSDTAFAVGNGTSHTARKNLFEIKTNGDIYVNGVKINLGT